MLVILLILFCSIRVCRKNGGDKKCCQKFYKGLSRFLFYDAFIRYMIESNLDLVYNNIFFVHLYMSFETNWEAQNSYIRIAMLAIIGLWMIVTTIFLVVKKDKL